MRIAIVTVSDTRTETTDMSGRLLASLVTEAGHVVAEKMITPDDIYQMRAIVSRLAVTAGIDVIVMTGGTGVTGRDVTPEALKPLLDKEIPGFAEKFRDISWQEIGFPGLLSRAIAGLVNGRIVFALPGSSNACRTAWEHLMAPALKDGGALCGLATLQSRFHETKA